MAVMCMLKAIHTLHIPLFNRDYIFIQFKIKNSITEGAHKYKIISQK